MSNALRILVVDDEQTIIQLLRILFEDAGYAVAVARSATEARSYFGEAFSAMILDKNLPDGDGVDLGREIKRVDPLCETILLTGYSNKEAAIDAVGGGFFAYVEKPVTDLDAFAFTVKNAVAKSQLQRRAQKNERLIEHMRKMDALGRLAAGVAHDFNNVLAVVGITAELLSQGDLSLEDVRAHGRELLDVVGTGRALARQLVVFGRGSNAQLELVNLNDMTSGMMALLSSIVGRRQFKQDLASNLRFVRGDRDQLSQILLNLIVNAADATPISGGIAIQTRNASQAELHDRGLSEHSHVVLSVQDNGSGIAPDALERIFEPYFTTKPEGKGTGLGLATVFGVAQKHGGRVFVQSTVGQGTLFDVYLPAAD